MPEENTESTEGTTEEWTGPSQEEWQQMQEVMGMIREAAYAPEQEQEQAKQEEKPAVKLDPFSDTYDQDLKSLIQESIQESVAPYSKFTEEQILSEAEARALDIINDLEAQAKEKGKEPLPEGGQSLVRALANEYIDAAQQQYGFGPQAAEAALAAAYEEAQDTFNKYAEARYEQKMKELGTVASARREPDASTPAAQGVDRVKGDEMSLVRNIFGGR